MKTIEEAIKFVNQQLRFYSHQLTKNNLRNPKTFKDLHEKFTDLLKLLTALNESPTTEISNYSDTKTNFSLSPEDIEGLPAELIEELNLSSSDEAEFEIVNIIKKNGGVLSLDQLLIALYKETGEIHKRKLLVSKLYRMTTKGLIFNVPNKRAVYSASPIESEDPPQDKPDATLEEMLS